VNFGKSGFTGVSVGKRGRTMTVGKWGTYVNVGIPGTGLSYRARLDGSSGTAGNRYSAPRATDEWIKAGVCFVAFMLPFAAMHKGAGFGLSFVVSAAVMAAAYYAVERFLKTNREREAQQVQAREAPQPEPAQETITAPPKNPESIFKAFSPIAQGQPQNKSLFGVEYMPYIVHQDSGRLMYRIEGGYQNKAIEHILSLNPIIEEVGRFLGKEIPTIIPALICWQPYSEDVIKFTYLERCPLTPTGKAPKYEHCLQYMAALLPAGINELTQTPENYIFGQIYFQKEKPGKAAINIWQGLQGTHIDAKLIDGRLWPWKVREVLADGEMKTSHLEPPQPMKRITEH
jgi:hypothetical protein